MKPQTSSGLPLGTDRIPVSKTARTGQRRSLKARRARGLVRAAVCALAVGSTFGSVPAHAITFGGASGTYAGASIPAMTGGQVCNMMTGPLYFGCVYSPSLLSGSASVDRSRATSGAQIVTLDFQVWRYDGSAWQKHTVQRSQTTIAAGQGASNLAGLSRTVQNGYLRVTARLTWWTSDAKWLGQYDIAWPAVSDYSCRAPQLTCSTGPGWIKFGA